MPNRAIIRGQEAGSSRWDGLVTRDRTGVNSYGCWGNFMRRKRRGSGDRIEWAVKKTRAIFGLSVLADHLLSIYELTAVR